MWTPFLRIQVLHGPKKERDALLKKLIQPWYSSEYDILLTTYSIAVNDKKMVEFEAY